VSEQVTTEPTRQHEDEQLPADGQPPEVAELQATDPADIPPDEGDAEPDDIADEAPADEAGALRTGSVSGLSRGQRHEARRLAVAAAALGLRNKVELRYTQDSRRWQGIAEGLIAAKGEYPKWADCSSFATWCLWNGLKARFGIGDTVNGQSWRAGFTGTMLGHGKPVRHQDNWLLADLVLYGIAGRPPTQHVAILVGDGWVISHGSDAAPYKVRWNYRNDVIGVRRYI
jgi:hypothetical protein